MLGREQQRRRQLRQSRPPAPPPAILGDAVRVRCGVCRAFDVCPGTVASGPLNAQ